jgi:signal transduction histidine kinase
LLQVFDALLDNAAKFSPDGGTIHVSLHSSSGIIYAKIADPGVGIPADQLVRIWKPPRRVVNPGPMPLFEVRRIVEGHGGQVWAESVPGQGSTFFVALRKPIAEIPRLRQR